MPYAAPRAMRRSRPAAPALPLRYVPGLYGQLHNRASTASQRTATGQVETLGVSRLRDRHYVQNPVSGLFERTTLIEEQRTNLVPNTNGRPNTMQASGSTPPTVSLVSVASPFGSECWEITFPAGVSGVSTCFANSDGWTYVRDGRLYSLTVWVEGVFEPEINLLHTGGQGTPQVMPTGRTTLVDGRTWREYGSQASNTAGGTAFIALRAYPVQAPAAARTIRIAASQVEEGATRSSMILGPTAPVTRAVDDLRLPLATSPQSCTVYVRYVDQGLTAIVGFPRLLSWGVSTGNRLWIRGNPGSTRLELGHDDGGQTNVSSPNTPIAYGDLVEARGLVYADGSVQLAVSVGGAAETIGVRSSAVPLPGSWGSTLTVASNLGSNQYGLVAVTHLVVLPGAHSLSECRAAAGVG